MFKLLYEKRVPIDHRSLEIQVVIRFDDIAFKATKERNMEIDINVLIPLVTFAVIAGWIGLVVVAEYVMTHR